MKFGEYIKSKRIKRNITQTKAAIMFGISLSYLSGIERGLRPAPSSNRLNIIANTLDLNQRERNKLYDLAAESKKSKTLADDLINYINENHVIRDIIRYSIECQLTEKEWNSIFTYVKNNYHY